MTFAPIGETIKQKAWRGPAKGIYLSLRIEKLLGELLPRGVKMVSYQEGKLNLLTPSPTASQDLYLHSAVIMKELNESLGGRVVEKIGFRLGSKTNDETQGTIFEEHPADLLSN